MRAIFVLFALAGCLRVHQTRCEDGTVCPDGTRCATLDTDPVCIPESCGDGVVESGEQCDDGNNLSGDGCPVDCALTCGDGVVDPSEQCDDGNLVSGDGCAGDCGSDERCGNTVLDRGELCDDGNAANHDGCSERCRPELAGWTSLGDAPSRRTGHVMVYDRARNNVVLFGGREPGAVSADTWSWDGARWRQHESSGVPPRLGHAMAYDAARERVVMFGGGPMNEFNNTWEWDGIRWVEQASTTDGPRQLIGAAMAYDARAQQVVLFGGTSGGERRDRTWRWDGAKWEQAPASGPSARTGHAMAYDERRGVIVMFGGTGDQALGDTWELDGNHWVQRSASSGPGARTGAAMVYDARRERVILLGGNQASASANLDLWEWTGANWVAVPAGDAPLQRTALGAAYDVARQRITVFGGQRFIGGATVRASLDDTWDWDGARWTPRSMAALPPEGRHSSGIAYDPVRAAIVMFGGVPKSELFLDDTWRWDGTRWSHLELPAGPVGRFSTAIESDGTQMVLFGGAKHALILPETLSDTWVLDEGTWTARTLPISPAARYRHAMAHDAERGTIVMFGGADGIDANGDVHWFRDTWLWNGTRWTEAHPAHLPPARSGHAMAYDPVRKRVVMYGGFANGTYLTDLWSWNGLDWTRDLPATTTPPAELWPTMAFDAARGKLVLMNRESTDRRIWEWSGTDWRELAPPATAPSITQTLVYDAALRRVVMVEAYDTSYVSDPPKHRIWSWDGSAWHIEQAYAPAPSARESPSTAFDVARGRTVLFGGLSPGVGPMRDTWLWDGERWQQYLGPQPDPLHGHKAAYDSDRERVVLIVDGGSTWEWDGTSWTDKHPSTQPSLGEYAVAYHAQLKQTLLIGQSPYVGDRMELWSFDGVDWTQIESSDSPRARFEFAAAYDVERDRLVVYGGYDHSNQVPDEVWEWDGKHWMRRAPPATSAPRADFGHTMAYDPIRRRVLSYGGETGGAHRSDVWAWDGTLWTDLSASPAPPVRSRAGMVYDPVRHELVIVGGTNNRIPVTSPTWFSDTWFFRSEEPR